LTRPSLEGGREGMLSPSTKRKKRVAFGREREERYERGPLGSLSGEKAVDHALCLADGK